MKKGKNKMSIKSVVEPSLYGITHSNRNFKDKYFWGKNQFNSSFPVALCCYMRDNNYGSVLISQKGSKTFTKEVSINDVFGTSLPCEKLRFCFETVYSPYADFAEDEVKPIDLVIKENESGKFIRPLEIKLTALPDDDTSEKSEDKYGSELVVRSPTMRYMALGLAKKCTAVDRETIKRIFENSCKTIRDWENQAEILGKKQSLLTAMNEFLLKFEKYQSPLVLQPIWKTVGKEPRLAKNCLDVFTWTDIGLARCIYDQAVSSRRAEITRHQRSMFRMARFLYEFAKSGKVFQQPIYDGMTFDTLNDKEFSLGGRITNPYMKCDRLLTPKVTKDEVKRIVLGGGQKFLSPERRFDAVLFFSTDLFES